MTAITTRQTGTTGLLGVTRKNAPLNNTEIDTNFINLNNNKLEVTNNLSDVNSLSQTRTNLGLVIGTNVQAFNTNLSALSSIATHGIYVKTAAGTSITRSITGAANEVVIGNADGIAGNIEVTLGSNIPRLNSATSVFSGDITAANFNASSDNRLKHNVSDLSNCIDTLKQISGRGFTWNNTNKKSFGVIAQELELILPELVQDQDGVKAVNYLGLIAFLINAVHELDKKIEDLKPDTL
jgi:hypothetical protein